MVGMTHLEAAAMLLGQCLDALLVLIKLMICQASVQIGSRLVIFNS